MLQDHEKDQIRTCLNALKQVLPGFRTRRAQLDMMAAVGRALGQCRELNRPNADLPQEATPPSDAPGPNIAVVEAGTGTGKTLGYLVPALVLAHSRGKRLVVSSSTVALQEQISLKDAPALQQVMSEMGLGFSFAVAKGRSRYACAAKLMAVAMQAHQRDIDEELGDGSEQDGDVPPAQREPVACATRTDRHRRIVRRLATEFEAQRWSGERDDLRQGVPDAVWQELVTDRHGCSGSRCPSFAHCPFYLARQKVREADLVIANHDLVLASLDMDAGSMLPPPGETFYVFDEAHTLSAKVVDHLAARHALKGAMEWVEGLAEAIRDAVLGLKLDASYQLDARQSARVMTETLLTLHQHLHGTRAFGDKRARRFKGNLLPDWAHALGEQLLSAAQALRETTLALREQMLERAQAEPHLVQQLLANLGHFTCKLDKLIDTWVLMLVDDLEGSEPVARWVERHDGTSPVSPSATSTASSTATPTAAASQPHDYLPHDYLICASPLSGGKRLRALLWRRVSAAVVTSATLTSCGRFDLFLDRSGLSPLRGLHLLQVASPFDYANRAQLVIPAMRCDPKQAERHTAEVARLLPELASTTGTLVLFASAKQMHDVHRLIPPALRQRVLMQGTLPKAEMLMCHRAAVDRGEPSILFGLTSLAEGVDLPLEYCTHVICAKLPFSVPDGPLEEARREFIESQGRSAFAEIALPEASVRLQQMAGRLMRTDEDYGRVTVLDRRLVTRPWGAMLLKGLPPFERVIESRS